MIEFWVLQCAERFVLNSSLAIAELWLLILMVNIGGYWWKILLIYDRFLALLNMIALTHVWRHRANGASVTSSQPDSSIITQISLHWPAENPCQCLTMTSNDRHNPYFTGESECVWEILNNCLLAYFFSFSRYLDLNFSTD